MRLAVVLFLCLHFSVQVLINTADFCSEGHDIVAYQTCAMTPTQWILEVPAWGLSMSASQIGSIMGESYDSMHKPECT